jgi:hypothetical protein
MNKAELVQLLQKKKAARAAYKTIMSDARTALYDERAALSCARAAQAAVICKPATKGRA